MKTLFVWNYKDLKWCFVNQSVLEWLVAPMTWILPWALPYLPVLITFLLVFCDIQLIFQTILELSKLHMAKFHYLVMKPSFKRAEICFTDTDSFLYHIFGANVRQRLTILAEFFDFSNYPSNHPMYSVENKSKPGRLVQKSILIPLLFPSKIVNY